jgi:hypothetical protein
MEPPAVDNLFHSSARASSSSFSGKDFTIFMIAFPDSLQETFYDSLCR